MADQPNNIQDIYQGFDGAPRPSKSRLQPLSALPAEPDPLVSQKKFNIMMVVFVVVLVLFILTAAVFAFTKFWPKSGLDSSSSKDNPSNQVLDQTVNQIGNGQSGSVIPLDDEDHDGLAKAREAELGTNPAKIDTDADGLFDGDEVNFYETNPLKPDTDGDGYADGSEVKSGYNPRGEGVLLNFQEALKALKAGEQQINR